MSEPRRRGPYARTRERRATIAQAALALVVEHGHRSVTTLGVAKRAGMSEAGLLYHFPSKEALLVAALTLFDEQEMSLLSPGESVAAAPALAVVGVRRTNIVHLYASLLGEAGNPEHPAHDYFKEHWRLSRARLAQDISLLQETGEVGSAVDPEQAAALIIAAWDGLQNHWLVDPSFDIGARLGAFIDAVLLRSPRGRRGDARKVTS
ncbi:TetR/AcrR family transcriptional regulator [Streptomyces sp. NPDC097107]|uniref:TetR/AcrR family transcriptional regulator n=1 Tax=Streptomyces sp. NPDC097107 TaxID=3366089 RepID=UPI00381A9D4E